QEWVTLRLSPMMNWFAFAVWPLVWCLESTVMFLVHRFEHFWKHRLDRGRGDSMELQELRASANIARTSRLIGSQEEKIILGAAELSQRPVREAMLPAD